MVGNREKHENRERGEHDVERVGDSLYVMLHQVKTRHFMLRGNEQAAVAVFDEGVERKFF